MCIEGSSTLPQKSQKMDKVRANALTEGVHPAKIATVGQFKGRGRRADKGGSGDDGCGSCPDACSLGPSSGGSVQLY